MARWILAVLIASAALHAQQPPAKDPEAGLQKQRTTPPVGSKQEVPPEEDTSVATKEYSFNPLQAQKEVQTGNFYFKKGNYRAAAGRFREAINWNNGYDEAWLRLGEAEEKVKDRKAAREAYTKFLELASDAKKAEEVRKRLDKLK